MATGLHAVLGSRAGNRVGILIYHRVADRADGFPEPSINVTPEQFRRQLSGLLDRGFQFLPLRDLLSGGPLPPKSVVVTFDDGFMNVFTEAWPILRDLGIPATVFLATAYLDSNDPFPFDRWGRSHQEAVPAASYRPLTTEQCREMAADGLIELGAHTHTHRDFRGNPTLFREDMAACLDLLRDRFGLPNATFAFPFGRRHLGYSSDELLAAVRTTGVLCALTTECELVDPKADPFGWGRFNAYEWDTAATLAAKLGGWYSWAPRLQGRLAGMRAYFRQTR